MEKKGPTKQDCLVCKEPVKSGQGVTVLFSCDHRVHGGCVAKAMTPQLCYICSGAAEAETAGAGASVRMPHTTDRTGVFMVRRQDAKTTPVSKTPLDDPRLYVLKNRPSVKDMIKLGITRQNLNESCMTNAEWAAARYTQRDSDALIAAEGAGGAGAGVSKSGFFLSR